MIDIPQENNKSANCIANSPLSIGQMYYPCDEELTDILRTIYNNKYYTNHGPLAIEFESSLSSYLGASHVIASTNATLGLMMVLVGLGVNGSVMVPSFSSPGLVEAVIWSGLTPVFCDVDENTGQVTADTISQALRSDTSTIIAVSLWGNICGIDEIASFASTAGLEIIHFAADSFGNRINGKKLGSNGVTTIFSFDSSKILSCSGGGGVVTDNDLLASKVRNIRSSYGAGPFTKVPVTANGRFSELQAAIGLWSLRKLENHRSHNKEITEIYRQLLGNIEGIIIYLINDSIYSNHQDFVIAIDSTRYGLDRDYIQDLLEERNIFTRSDCRSPLHSRDIFSVYHDGTKLPGAEVICKKTLQLPVGSQVSSEIAYNIGTLLQGLKA